MKRVIQRHLLLPLLVLGVTGGVSAQTDFSFGGRAGAEFGVAYGGTLPVAAAELELNASGRSGSSLFPDASFRASAFTRHDAADGNTTIRLGEAHATIYLGDLEFTAGKQRRAWGSTDGINPVDVLNPQDLSFPPAASKLAVSMLYGRYYGPGEHSFAAAVIPVFMPPVLPGAAWQPGSMPTGLPPDANVTEVREPVIEQPAAELANVQFGVRATAAAGGFDFSGTYFRGFRNQPTYSASLEAGASPGELTLVPRITFDPVHVLGVDFSGFVHDFVVRGEAAVTINRESAGADAFTSVLGLEYSFSGGPRLVMQGIIDRATPAGTTKQETNFRLMSALAHQYGLRTQFEVGWIHDFDGSGALMPELTYTFADGVTGTAAAWIFYGAENTSYGSWAEQSQVRISVDYAF